VEEGQQLSIADGDLVDRVQEVGTGDEGIHSVSLIYVRILESSHAESRHHW
jgi:hypothetical protein